ncbi:SLC13 family permease [uncultured Amaricoccus sp.]|uniref:SLC13 family permease n=1 Tax=uncultured Amaricoccus sp. TaxID=339341 RepID=UPI00261C31BD|nr:SLC13 family permease [uncultured Amaricoccus sp.]
MTLTIFLLTYAGMALGRIPGFRVDRTGVALLGAIALLVSDRIAPEAAWMAVSFPTVALLFGLMVVSSAFIVSGFYDWVARWVAGLPLGPRGLLALLIGVAAVLSSILTNDVVAVAMVPLILQLALARGLNPVPLLLGFCFAANTGAAGTVIGSPQNMIIAQGLNLSFTGFMAAALLPSMLSLGLIWGVLALVYRGKWLQAPVAGAAAPSFIPFERLETAKAALVTLVVVIAFMATDWPRENVALGAAAVLLLNRRFSSTDMLAHVDGEVLLLLGSLFIVNAAMAATGLPQEMIAALRDHGVDLAHPMTSFLTMGVLSDIVGNNPAALLLTPYLPRTDPELTGAALALGSGFSSNVVIFGSLAGMIVVQTAQKHGVTISLGEFSKAGIPVTILCMLLGAGWLLFLMGA